MFDKLRDQIAHELSGCRIGVLSSSGELGPQSVPVQYRVDGLAVECLIPRWSELAYELEGSGRVILIVLPVWQSDQRWIRYQGRATPVDTPDWTTLLPGEQTPADRYVVARIRPMRIELFDQGQGWGSRETFDLE